jgi:hypothetical protein
MDLLCVYIVYIAVVWLVDLEMDKVRSMDFDLVINSMIRVHQNQGKQQSRIVSFDLMNTM